jgi:hypothetical protein
MSVATLGISVDSSAVKSATVALNQLTSAAKPAAAAATSLAGAAATAGPTVAGMATASRSAGTAHAGLSTQSLAAFHSIRSLGEAIASGMPLTTALAQQVNHLAYAASGPGGLSGAFSGAIGALTRFISPAGLVAAGLIGVGAAGALAIASIAKSEVALDDLAQRAGITIQALHGLQSAAAFKGISVEDFTKGLTEFANASAEAQHNMGSLGELLRANGQAAGSFEDNLLKVADLVKNTNSEADKYKIITAAGLPATAEWVRLLSQGSVGINAAIASATAFGGAADENLIKRARAFDESWNRGWNNFVTKSKSAIVETIGFLDSLSSKAEDALKAIGVNVDANKRAAIAAGSISISPPPPTTTSAAGNGTTVDPNVLRNKLNLETPMTGRRGTMETVASAKPTTKPPANDNNKDDRNNLRTAA